MERVLKTLPNGYGFEWTELTFQQKASANVAILVFPLCVLLVFLILSAQYESWSLPLAIILIVPMCLLSSMIGVKLSGSDNNILTQIGFIILVGLACKNAILIVEFGKERYRTLDDADVGFDAFWELDFFGRVRRGVQAARADEQASAAGLRDVQVTVTAEVARNYFVLRGLQEQLAVAVRNAENQEQTWKLTQVRLEAGRGTELDTARAEAQLKSTLATVPLLESSIATTIYRLSVLTGRVPDALTTQLQTPQPLDALPALNAIGDPASLLRRRPDIRVAERSLAASTARIGVAMGDLFPKVTFTGAIGYDAASFGRLGKTGSDTYSIGPAISWAAFDLGRVSARIKIARAQTEADLAAYEESVLGALEETEGALITYGRAQTRRDLLTEAANASERAADLARQRFQGGLTDFVNVLEAERDALAVQDSLAQSHTQTATALVAVYKALGGGWTDEPL